MTDDQFLLASAYFDDEVDAHDKARAEADPIVMTEVARLRTLRADLRRVPAAAPATRARAIEAALDAWSTTTTTATTSASTPPSAAAATPSMVGNAGPEHRPPAPPTSLESARSAKRSASRWTSSSRLLTAAAAVVAVAFGAVMLTRGDQGDSSAAIEAGAVEETAASADQGSTYGSVADATPDEGADAPAATAPDEAKLAEDKDSTITNSPSEPSLPPFKVDPPVEVTPLATLQFSDEDLRLVADQFLNQGGAGGLPPIAHQCDLATPETATVIGYTSALNSDVERSNVQLLILVDDVDQYSFAYAVDVETCAVVRATVLPS